MRTKKKKLKNYKTEMEIKKKKKLYRYFER